MSPRAAQASYTSSPRTRSDRSERPDVTASDLSILRRRDIALYPLILISIGAFALALSQALRPAGQESVAWGSPVILAGSIAFGVVVGSFAAAQEFAVGKRFLGSLWFYFFGAALLLAGLTAVAVLDRGLDSVGYSAVFLLASYAGLVFPGRWSRAALVGLLGLTGVIQLVRPEADYLAAGTVFVLIVAGWIVGLLPRLGHRAASREALLLSRSDALTRAMNRRGFLEQFSFDLARAKAVGEPIALLIIDLNGFKAINDEQGHAAGDAILSWTGDVVPPLLPSRAAFGRLGGDEFAVLLPGLDAVRAEALASELRTALAARIGASIGVSSQGQGLASEETLMFAADAALYRAKSDPTRRVQYAEADPAPAGDPDAAEPPRPVLTYAQLRSAGVPQSAYGPAIFDGRLMVAGFCTIALSGVPIVGNMLLFGGHTFFEDVIRYLGIPWALTNLGLGLWYRNHPRWEDPPNVSWWSSAVLVGGGVGAAALSSGHGIADTIMAGFTLKLLFDASVVPAGRARQNAVILLVCWGVVATLGPRDVLWAAPFQLVIFLGAHMLGGIGRAAFESARNVRITIAKTDPLTGLLNRAGFEATAGRAIAQAASSGQALAVVMFDLDDFKGVNDTLGHAAGDQLLRSVAQLTGDALAGAHAIGRLGGDEFVAVVPVATRAALLEQLAQLDSGLSVLVGGSVGYAVLGDDGDGLKTLLQVADARAYAVKASRPDRHHRRGAVRELGPHRRSDGEALTADR